MKYLGNLLSKTKILCQRYRLPILSGILIGTSYIPSYPIAVFWSFVPLWLFWLKNFQTKEVFWAGWITQFLLTLIGFHWVAHTAHVFGHLPWVLSILVLIGFCAFSNLHIVLAGLIWSWIRRRYEMSYAQSALMLATLTVLGESLFPMIFPWNHGYVWLWADWKAFHFADVIGIQGLSAIAIFANAFFLMLWKLKEKKEHKNKLVLGPLFFALFFAGINFAGKKHGEPWNETDSEKQILVVQANIGNIAKFLAAQGEARATSTIANKYFKLTEKALFEGARPDFILWPETAYPEYLNPRFQFRLYYKRLQEFVRRHQVPLITGGYRRLIKEDEIYNSLFLVETSGKIQEPPYSKSILLAFGEYFPGADTFPFLKKIVPTISDFSSGPGPISLPFYGVNFGPQICYEGLYPEFSSELAKQGAQIFINVTNDSWFGHFFQAYQHLYMTLGRALEARRPLVRSTNTGITTAILANGEILAQSPTQEEWAHNFSIKYKENPPLTFFSLYGHYLNIVFIGLFALILLWVLGAKRKIEKE